jgi:hypothetical protein
MADMCVIVPTRERAPSLARFTAAAGRTMSGDTELLFVMDDDDPLLDDNRKAVGEWEVMTLPRQFLVPKMNHAAMRKVTDYRVLMFLGDDVLPITPGWDASIVAAIDALGSGYAYPNDLLRADIPEHVAISSDIVSALGWMACPAMDHFYIDNAWADLGHGAGCLTYCEDVVMEHLHWTLGKSPRDHVNNMAIARGGHDQIKYQEWRDTRLAADLETVRGVRDGKEARSQGAVP